LGFRRIGQRVGGWLFALTLLAGCSSPAEAPATPATFDFTLTAATLDLTEQGDVCNITIQEDAQLEGITISDENGRVVGVASPPQTGRLHSQECDLDMVVKGIPETVTFLTISSSKLGIATISKNRAKAGYTFVLSLGNV
jgi:hypothetical protein